MQNSLRLAILLWGTAVSAALAATPYLGIRTVPMTSDNALRFGLATNRGVLVGRIDGGSPAEKAGLQEGDLILDFDGRSVGSVDELRTVLSTFAPGQRRAMTVWRERQRRTLEVVTAEKPAAPPTPRAPGPSTEEPWYLHGEGDWWLRQPAGWQSVADRRNTTPDKRFDSLLSGDGSLVIILWKQSETVNDAGQALKQFENEKRLEFPNARSRRVTVGGAPGVCVAYYGDQGTLAVSRISFVLRGRRYVINTVAPARFGLERLPPPIADALGSLQFLRRISSPIRADPGRPPVEGVVGPTPTPPPTVLPTPPSSADGDSETGKPGAPSDSAPPGWTRDTVSDLVVFVPRGWEPVPFLASDEGRWFKGNEDSPEATIAVVRDRTREDLVRDMKIKKQTETRVAGKPADCCIGTTEGGTRMVVIPKRQRSAASPFALVFFASGATWESHEATFRQFVGIVESKTK